MIQEIEYVTVTIGMKPTGDLKTISFVKGLTTPDGHEIIRILHHKDSGQIDIKHEGGLTQLNKHQKEIAIDGKWIRCLIYTGREIHFGDNNSRKGAMVKPSMTRRPDPPPPLKRREPSPIEEELKLMHEYLAESERKNKVLTEKLDSMRKAYHAEADENARLKQNLPVPHESYEIMIDDRGNEIERYETNDIVRLQNRNERLEYSYRESSNLARFYERKLAEEKKVSSYLTEEDRFKAKMSGALISSGAGAIVYTLFNLFL